MLGEDYDKCGRGSEHSKVRGVMTRDFASIQRNYDHLCGPIGKNFVKDNDKIARREISPYIAAGLIVSFFLIVFAL